MKNLLPISVVIIFLLFTSCKQTSKQVNSKVKAKTSSVTAPKENVSNSLASVNTVVFKKAVIPKKRAENYNLSQKKELLEVEKLKKLHECYLNESPYKNTLTLSKSERKAIGLVPNKYFEAEWENTINPALGRPTPENLEKVRKQLAKEKAEVEIGARTPGDAADNSWVERGPTNVGGRTRAIIFDPNDPTNETVFAGGVSGGIWKNTNISNPNSNWTRVNIPENLSVSCIAVDPNNTNIFYVGTGESYVGGDVNGDGVWKSTDGGVNWARVLGGITGSSYFQSATSLTVNTPFSATYPSIETVAFGVPVTTPIIGNIVLVDDSSGAPTEGCNALTVSNAAAVNNNIALIRRGNCNFTQKIINAKNAGAIAVIIMNQVSGNPTAIGGVDTNSEINIPSIAISKENGDTLEASLLNNTVSVTINPSDGTFTANIVPGIQHINDIIIRNNAGVSEVYVAAADGVGYASSLGGTTFGLYKSSNGGTTWNEINLPLTDGGFKHCPNDLEITAGNKIWLATTNSFLYGEGGGKVFSSTDGVNFTQKFQVPFGRRTQIAVSKINANKVYVLSQVNVGITITKTVNDFLTTTIITPPVDADPGIPANDFTRGQSFYDLLIATDPQDDNSVFVGGIDLFNSSDGGTSFSQLSHWYGGFGYQNVHADQHGIAFTPNASSKILFSNDGGVYYSSDGGGNVISRNKGFNVTQFYTVGVAPTGATGGNLVGDYFAAGAQDNGTQYFGSAIAGTNISVESDGGDGAYTFFDQGADKYYITNYVYNRSINRRTTAGLLKVINNEPNASNGAFIAPMVLDSNLNILYSDYSTGTTYQIRRYTNVGLTGTVGKSIIANALLTASPSAFAISKYTTASTTMLVGTRNGKVLRVTSANGSPIWTDISTPFFVGTISDIEYGTSESEIFVTLSNYGVTSIWYTANGTSATPTWVSKEGNFPDIPVKCILQNPLLPTTEVIIGTELGVWYTNNFNAVSPIWRQSFNGMRNVKVTDLDLRNDNKVFAATYGRGIFSGSFLNTVLSNESFENNKNVAIYPNPVKEILNISIKNYSGNVVLKISDVTGKIVYQEKVTNFNLSNSINISNMSKGVYILNVEGDSLNFSEKIIIQ